MMDQRLIGDIGGTSADWALLRGKSKTFFKTGGFNPSSQSEERLAEMHRSIKAHVTEIEAPLRVHYFGAGIHYPGAREQIRSSFDKHYHLAELQVASDLLAAAIAVCGTQPGLVAILGTGSNICAYDGNEISGDGLSLGYPIGDEGSGYDIGRRLVKDFYYRNMPSSIRDVLKRHLPSEAGEFVTHLNASATPNKWVGSLVGLIRVLRSDAYVQRIVSDAFHDFCTHHLHRFKSYQKINFAGSIAFYFCSELKEVLQTYQLEVGVVEKRPIEGLASFYGSQTDEHVE